ncbi:hypothetical protein ACVI1L_002367 [Bradyrhizobium sp. USDA 4516]
MLVMHSDALHRNQDDLAELGSLLAAGLQRLLERKSSPLSHRSEENPLDCGAVVEGHVRRNSKEMAL